MSFCGTSFWDSNLSWDTNWPDLTVCFQETTLILVPCIFLFLFSIFEIFTSKKSRKKYANPWTFINLTKIILSILLTSISLAEIIYFILFAENQNNFKYPIYFYSSIIKFITFLYTTVLILYHRRNGIYTSGTLFIFWLLFFIVSLINLHSIIRMISTQDNFNDENLNEFIYITKNGFISIIFIELVLSSFSDSIDNSIIVNVKISPEKSASFLSKITFNWFTPIILKGFRRPLVQDDLWLLHEENKTENLLKDFNKNWLPKYEKLQHNIKKDKKAKSQISIVGPIIKTYWIGFVAFSSIKIITCFLPLVSPMIMDLLISFINNDEPVWRGYFYASLMFFVPMIESVLNNYYEYGINTISMRVRACLISIIYKKGLKLSSKIKKDFTTGEIVNLMSIDAQRIVDYINVFNNLWVAPLQIVACLLLLWQQMGLATIAGISLMILLIPINAVFTSKFEQKQKNVMKEKDKRIKLFNEILNGIKVLKLYAWETSFVKKITGFRNSEVKSLKSQAFYQAFMFFFFSSTSFYVGLVTFTMFVLLSPSNILDANKAFVSLALFNFLRVPMSFLPFFLASGAMALVSLRRINSFLNAEELDENVIGKDKSINCPVYVEKGTFSWDETENPALKDISVKIKPKKLVAIVGQIGSGKTSFLSSILGDMEKLNGIVNINGSIAYVPQQAWIQNATLKQNILFTKSFHKEKYERIIDACALRSDFRMFQAGDMTEIGEKGINLSGGQKQRVSLARAVYQSCDIYLLDDPLSAVDAHVGKHLFDKVIGPNGLLSNKTRVLVTHKVSILPETDEIIVIKEGKIAERGSFEELIKKKGEFAEFIAEHLGQIEENEELSELESISESVRNLIQERSISRTKSETITSDNSKKFSKEKEQSDNLNKKNKNKNDGKLIDVEGEETGSVKLSIYSKYVKAMGIGTLIIILIGFIISNGFQVANTLWLEQWSADAYDPIRVNDTKLRDQRLYVYGILGVGETFFNLVSTLSLSLACVSAAKILHNKMLDSIIRSPMSFFDTTPTGRIMNRFSRDIDTTDFSIAMNLRITVMQLFRTIVALGMISLQSVILLIGVVPIVIIYYLVQKIYIETSRQLRRIDSTSRSPIYNHFSETIQGITSIRAYGAKEQFVNESNQRIDTNHKCYYLTLIAARWLGVRLEFLGYCIVFLTAMFSVIYRDTLSPGIAGISISYALNITAVLGVLVRFLTDLETNFVSVERIIEYTSVQSEAEWHNDDMKPNIFWPENGEIKFNKYSTKYREGLDLVLKKVSFKVKPGEKIGVVGRTGAGKSSLTLALFRLIEPVDGTIYIDQVDVSKIGLYDLRSKLTIIPQDPALFTGTLRFNLDPFDKYLDKEIWTSLELAHLKSFVQSLDKQLNYQITEGGDNLSVGQKQLVCLARALLKKSKILVLDEATAAVDMETDDLIQETIRKEFKDCTIVTIAHRLNTIIDYDRILVMNQGEIAEFDFPQVLLDNNKSIFYSMAKEAGII